jgi:hypothetical protein
MVFAGNNGGGAANGPGPFPKLRYMEVANISGGWQIGFDLLDLSPLVEEVAYPPGSVPVAAWQCLEWDFEDNPDHITFWINGTQSGTFDNTDIAYYSPNKPAPGTIYNGMTATSSAATTRSAWGSTTGIPAARLTSTTMISSSTRSESVAWTISSRGASPTYAPGLWPNGTTRPCDHSHGSPSGTCSTNRSTGVLQAPDQIEQSCRSTVIG